MLENMNKTVLLLTGTVNSSGVHFLKRNNTEERLRDYLGAIEKWLRNYNIYIVFVENSNFPKESLGNDIVSNEKFEYITYNGQDFSRSRGKGYGEINSFEYAFKNSKFLRNADYVVKCNGRYFFKGFFAFDDIAVDLIGDFKYNLTFMDSRVFGFKHSFFNDYLLKYKDLIDDSNGVFFEHILAMAAHELLSDNGKWSPIPFPLIIDGYSGTDNHRYSSLYANSKKYANFYIKKITNWLEK
jgi:hypothetical protein